MTNEIEELEALLEKATPGPWEVETTDGVFKQTVSKSTEVGELDSVICDNEPYYPKEVSEDNQNFIAAARNLLPTLLQSLKDKDAEIERLREALRSPHSCLFMDGRNEFGAHLLYIPGGNLDFYLLPYDDGGWSGEDVEQTYKQAEDLGYRDGHAIAVIWDVEMDEQTSWAYNPRVSDVLTSALYGTAQEQEFALNKYRKTHD